MRGENVSSGYWKDSGVAPVLDADGWFHTGDLGERDAKGNLYFKGRQKNVIVTPAGLNIYPEDLEAELRKEPNVRDCVVIGLDRDGNAEPCAVLLLRAANSEDSSLRAPLPVSESAADSGALRQGTAFYPEARKAAVPKGATYLGASAPEGTDAQTSTAAQIVASANSRLAEFQRLRSWIVWREPDFPRTPTQKPILTHIREAALAELSGHDSSPAQAQSAAPSTVAGVLQRISSGSASPKRRLATHLDRTSGTNQRARRSLSSGFERGGFFERHLRRRSRKAGAKSRARPADRRCRHPRAGISLPPLAALVASPMDSRTGILRSSSPGHATARMAARPRTRKSPRRKRSGADRREPRLVHRPRIRAARSPGAPALAHSSSNGRRNAHRFASSSPGHKFLPRDPRPHSISTRNRPVPRVPTTRALRIP